MNNVIRCVLLSYLSICCISHIQSQHVIYPQRLYEDFRKVSSPINNKEIKINPTELLWPSVKYWEGRDVVYNVYLSRDSLFPETTTFVSKNQRTCFYNPHKILDAGIWYWKYDIVDKDKIETKGIYSFVVPPKTITFESPCFTDFANNISKNHPRIMNQGNDINSVRKQMKNYPAYNTIVNNAMNALEFEVYQGPYYDENPAVEKRLQKMHSIEFKRYHDILQCYVLTGEEKLLDNLLSRINILLTWPTHDLLGSQVLTALSLGYDALYNELPANLKKQILQKIEQQMCSGLEKWPGGIETKQVENHFWQMEISGNFCAALATIHDSEIAKEMLKYTYELFIARFPNLSTKYDGGWAEGMGYFAVNNSCIINMALWMKKIAGVDVFHMPWYKKLSDYYIYFAPVNGQIEGFGDSHERKENGNKEGTSISFILSCESHYPSANYRLLSQFKAAENKSTFFNSIEPWYQMVNSIQFNSEKLVLPDSMPNEKVFYSTGLAAMHTDIKNVDKGTSVYFRSSPFGAKGHMHANQNSFNIARKGERIFYSSGYYTSFADPHSMTSYRNTRASNTILVNDCGQAFGHEGYGFIKRFLAGKEITYVCGDATAAYKPTTDKQFLTMNAENGIKETQAYGVGDSKLKLFERHLAFIRPNLIVIYDVLESEQDCNWTFLLHTMKDQQPTIEKSGTLRVVTPLNTACVNVFGSSFIQPFCTNQFFSPAIDFKKKYKEVPNQYHISYKTAKKSKRMRYLAILQLGENGDKLTPIHPNHKGEIRLGDITISAEMSPTKPAKMNIKTTKTSLDVQPTKTILKDTTKKQICYNQYPEQMHR